MATAKLVLESAIDALTRRTLVVANLLGKLKAEIFQAPGFGSQFLRQRRGGGWCQSTGRGE